jgi:hypothetical protein
MAGGSHPPTGYQATSFRLTGLANGEVSKIAELDYLIHTPPVKFKMLRKPAINRQFYFRHGSFARYSGWQSLRFMRVW